MAKKTSAGEAELAETPAAEETPLVEAPAKKAAKAEGASKENKKQVLEPAKLTDELVLKYKTHEKDTGSLQVQVTLLTRDIEALAKHLTEHKKDFDSRRGLLIKVARRRRLLTSLRTADRPEYERLIADLGLRK